MYLMKKFTEEKFDLPEEILNKFPSNITADNLAEKEKQHFNICHYVICKDQ